MPSSEEDAGAVSLLEAGTVSLLLDSGVSLDAGASELEDTTSAELDTGVKLDKACAEELSGTDVSAPELESSPQEARDATRKAAGTRTL